MKSVKMDWFPVSRVSHSGGWHGCGGDAPHPMIFSKSPTPLSKPMPPWASSPTPPPPPLKSEVPQIKNNSLPPLKSEAPFQEMIPSKKARRIGSCH